MYQIIKEKSLFRNRFFPSGQRNRLKGSDILKKKDGRLKQEEGHETSQAVCAGEQTLLSSRTEALSRL
jgi:hypothetical protein